MKQSTATKILQGVRENYDRIAEHFSMTRHHQWFGVEQMIINYIQPGSTVLDIGCGNGRVSEIITKIKGNYTGIDIAPKLIAQAQEKYPKADFHAGSMTDLPFSNGIFSHAMMIASLYHVPSHQFRVQALQEANRVLQPGGILMMSNWNLHQWKYSPERWRSNIAKLLHKHDMDWNDVMKPWKAATREKIATRYCHSFTQREIKGLAHEAGFTIVEQYYERNGMHVPRRSGFNLFSVLRKTP